MVIKDSELLCRVLKTDIDQTRKKFYPPRVKCWLKHLIYATSVCPLLRTCVCLEEYKKELGFMLK